MKPLEPDLLRVVHLADGRRIDEAEVGSEAVDRVLSEIEVVDATAFGDAKRHLYERG